MLSFLIFNFFSYPIQSPAPQFISIHLNMFFIFSDVIESLHKYVNPHTKKHSPMVSPEIFEIVKENKEVSVEDFLLLFLLTHELSQKKTSVICSIIILFFQCSLHIHASHTPFLTLPYALPLTLDSGWCVWHF